VAIGIGKKKYTSLCDRDIHENGDPLMSQVQVKFSLSTPWKHVGRVGYSSIHS
jgi:hypothetical protein